MLTLSFPIFISEPVDGFVYALEPTRRGSHKLNATQMRVGHGVDWKVPYAKVPLSVRRAAKAHFGF